VRKSAATIGSSDIWPITFKQNFFYTQPDCDRGTDTETNGHRQTDRIATARALQHYAQNPLDTFPHNFPVDGEVAHVGLLPVCYGFATGKLRGNWCSL